ncbi:MAG: AMP-binding protein [Deltaproteobacteria bacterium]|nr:AMP-binding protein [Deltaproteobacteria bacterium]
MRGNIDSIGDMLRLTAEKHPHRTAIVFENGRITYWELNRRVNSLANALIGLGLGKGDRAAFLYLNSPEFVTAWFAIAKAGGVGVPLNFGLVARELSHQIAAAGARALLHAPLFADRIGEIRKELETVRIHICDGRGGSHDWEELLSGASQEEPAETAGLYDPGLILYTAGVTGIPKGALLTHRNCLFNAFTCAIDYGLSGRDVLQIIPPLFHPATLNCMLLPGIVLGASAVIHRRFDPAEMLSAVEREGVTAIWGPATMWLQLLRHPGIDRYDRSSVRLIANGAMPLTRESRKEVLGLFPNAAMMDVYGVTESSPGATILRPAEALERPASIGRPLTLTDVRIIDRKGAEAPPGVIGEIAIRGNLFERYDRMPGETDEAVRDGFFRTGDMGRRDADGFLYLVDRKADVIRTDGEEVYSREVEEVLQANPKVLESAVIGVPDEMHGERVEAVVACRQESGEEELIAWCRQNLAAYKCPGRVHFVKEIPKTPAGKIVKAVLRRRYSSD